MPIKLNNAKVKAGKHQFVNAKLHDYGDSLQPQLSVILWSALAKEEEFLKILTFLFHNHWDIIEQLCEEVIIATNILLLPL